MQWASQVVPVVKNLPTNAGYIREEDLTPGWEDPLEEGMATHSSILTWRIPCSEEPGGLQSIGSQRVGYNWSDLACITCMHSVHQALCSKLCRIKCLEASAYISSRRCFCHPKLGSFQQRDMPSCFPCWNKALWFQNSRLCSLDGKKQKNLKSHWKRVSSQAEPFDFQF